MIDDFYTLREAALWIAFKDTNKPLDFIYKHWSLMVEAQETILYNALLTGRIHISSDQTKNIIYRGSYLLDFENNIIRPQTDFYELRAAQTNIKISVSDMHREFPVAPTGAKIETGYTAPYIEVANTVINKMGITNDNQPLKKNMIDIIKEELNNRNLPCSNRKAEEIATLIRLPELEKGGNRRFKKH